MPSTVLVSFSLLALVVTARPIIPQRDTGFVYEQIADVQSAVQAVFESHTRESNDAHDLTNSNYDIHLLSSEEQIAYLSQLESGSIKALVPLDESKVLSEDEQRLIRMLGSSDRMDDVEGASRPLSDLLSPSTQQVNPQRDGQTSTTESSSSSSALSTHPLFHTKPIIILTVSCILALLSLACIGGFLYAVHYVRAYLFRSHAAWNLLPQLEKQQKLGGHSFANREKLAPLGLDLPPAFSGIRIQECELDEKAADLGTEDECQDASSNESTPTATPRAMRSVLTATISAIDPLLIPLPPSPRNSQTRIEEESPSLVSPFTTPRPGRLVLNEGRHNSVLDYALALQLRPGFGVDPTWLLRFLVSIFGWVVVLVGGPREPQRAQ